MGNYKLLEGSARLKLENGVLLRLAGPANFEIVDRETIQVDNGEWFCDIPRKVNSFSCIVGDFELIAPRNASFFLAVNSVSQWESMLTRGQLTLARPQSETSIDLSKQELNHAVFTTVETESGTPQTLVAKGKRRFLAQCFDGDKRIQIDYQENFQQFLTHVVGNENVGWNRFVENMDEFTSRMQKQSGVNAAEEFRQFLFLHLRNSFPQSFPFSSDGFETPATSFRGSLNINGVETYFDSLEEFNRAKQQMLANGTFSPESDPSPSFRVGDQRIEFSTTESFKHMRRKMNK
jgi:hypothetical protein